MGIGRMILKRKPLSCMTLGVPWRLDSELIRKVCTCVYTHKVRDGLKVFMKRMLVNEISDDKIHDFIENNSNLYEI